MATGKVSKLAHARGALAYTANPYLQEYMTVQILRNGFAVQVIYIRHPFEERMHYDLNQVES